MVRGLTRGGRRTCASAVVKGTPPPTLPRRETGSVVGIVGTAGPNAAPAEHRRPPPPAGISVNWPGGRTDKEAPAEERPMHDAESANAPTRPNVPHSESHVPHTPSHEVAAPVSSGCFAGGERK